MQISSEYDSSDLQNQQFEYKLKIKWNNITEEIQKYFSVLK